MGDKHHKHKDSHKFTRTLWLSCLSGVQYPLSVLLLSHCCHRHNSYYFKQLNPNRDGVTT